jgi:hypothetical protein
MRLPTPAAAAVRALVPALAFAFAPTPGLLGEAGAASPAAVRAALAPPSLAPPAFAPPAVSFPDAARDAAPASRDARDSLHAPWDALLRAHVRNGLVDYDAMARAASLPRYLDALAAVRADTLPRDARLAYWINVYNAYTVALIVETGERRSIKRIDRTFGLVSTGGPWRRRFVRADGRTLTLDEVEHEIIRREFAGEPRIHFALVCAAMGCPPLRASAYTADSLDAQLDDQARRFVARSPAKNRVDVATRTWHASPIFDWYGEDFAPDRAALGRVVARWLPEGPARSVLERGDFRIAWTEYDWDLNAQR